MKNNKNIDREDIKVGMRVKMALPRYYAFHGNKDRNKQYTWWKGKVVYVKNGAFSVNLGPFIGTVFVGSNMPYRMVKCR